jgi:hypothetical protein
MTWLDWTAIILTLLIAAVLLHPRLRRAEGWRAIVTPLASIIGSGFLVVAPLLGNVAGSYAVLAMAGIVIAAYGIGAVIRFNITHSEAMEADGSGPAGLRLVARTSNLALSVAYVISVAFYIRLLSSFVLSQSAFVSENSEVWLATAILAGIGLVGWLRGLKGLEQVETVSVSIKLSIIGAMILVLALYNAGTGQWTAELASVDVGWWTRLRMLGGMLLVVQGFETSRYLGQAYGPGLRSRSMRRAQIISGLIYVVFVVLVVPVLVFLPLGDPTETAIISVTGNVAWVLPFLLILAAFMSQLSAAIADTVGAGGLVSEETAGRLRQRWSYPLLIAFSVALIWLFDIFEVISIASRSFAFYYMLQAVIAFMVAGKTHSGRRKFLLQTGFSVAVILLALVVGFALPVE